MVAGLMTLMVSSPAFAADIDFRSSAFAGANNRSGFSYTASDGVTLTVTAGPTGARLYQDSQDGFGVRASYENDEIEGYESLSIGFSEDVLLTDLFITDLFIERPFLGLGRSYAEVGYYTIDGDTTTFHAITSGGNGELTLTPNLWADGIVFRAPGLVGFQNHEFSVGGLSYTTRTAEVPELDPSAAGAAMLLLVGAVLMLGERRRSATTLA
jgi:hypothetical protein